MAVAILGLIATLFTIVYTLWPMRRIFFGSLPQSLSEVREAPLTMTLPLLAVVVVSIVIGIYPDLVFKPLYSFASGLNLGLR
jgi:NADH-quinone oxidoreductase subunit M